MLGCAPKYIPYFYTGILIYSLHNIVAYCSTCSSAGNPYLVLFAVLIEEIGSDNGFVACKVVSVMNRAERRRLEKEKRKNKVAQPASFEELLQPAMHKLQVGDIKQADKLFHKLVTSFPNEPTSLHFAGITKYQLGAYADAELLLSKTVQVAPSYAEAHNSLGIVYLEQRNHESAYQCFKNAVDIKPDYANGYTNLGNALKALNRMSEAVSAFEAALNYNPQSTEAAYSLAATLLTLDKPQAALDVSNNCLVIDPYCQNANAYKAIALSRLNQKSEWSALYNFDEMIRRIHLEVPNDFVSLQDFNDKLEKEIRNHSTLTWEPLERVTHGGAVTKDMLLQPSKIIAAFEKTLRKAIDHQISKIKHESNHPFLNRVPARYRLTLIASILRAKGWHPPHIHESSWLSGVYYVRVPSAINDSSAEHAGWLQFGVPDCKMPENYTPDVTVTKPEEGLAVTFPSYFFHGTIPYAGDGERIGIAFDVYPL